MDCFTTLSFQPEFDLAFKLAIESNEDQSYLCLILDVIQRIAESAGFSVNLKSSVQFVKKNTYNKLVGFSIQLSYVQGDIRVSKHSFWKDGKEGHSRGEFDSLIVHEGTNIPEINNFLLKNI